MYSVPSRVTVRPNAWIDAIVVLAPVTGSIANTCCDWLSETMRGQLEKMLPRLPVQGGRTVGVTEMVGVIEGVIEGVGDDENDRVGVERSSAPSPLA
jgi:hypothetical protein